MKVYNVNLNSHTVASPFTMRLYHTQTMVDFKEAVAQRIGGDIDPTKMHCVRERYNDLKLLGSGDRTIRQEGFIKSNKV